MVQIGTTRTSAYFAADRLAIALAAATLLSCSTAALPASPSPTQSPDPRVEVALELNRWVTSWNSVVVASKDGQLLTTSQFPFMGDLRTISINAENAGAPLPVELWPALTTFVQTLNPNDPFTALPSLIAEIQREEANKAMAALRLARSSYPTLIEPFDFALPRRITIPAHDLVLTLNDMPAGFTLKSEKDCREGLTAAQDCWERVFEDPSYFAQIQVSRLVTSELAQRYFESLAKPRSDGQSMSLGQPFGDVSGGWTQTTSEFVYYVVAARVANSTVSVFVGSRLAAANPALAIEIGRLQVARIGH